MTKRLAYKLILLLLCVAGGQTSIAQTWSRSSQYIASSTFDSSRDNPTLWQDIGMCDVLAITGGSALTPPTTVRVVHNSPVGIVFTTKDTVARYYSTQRLSPYSPYRKVSGYIHMICCLRL